MREEPLPKDLNPSDLSPDELLYLALHVRDRVLDRIADAREDEQCDKWTEAIANGFADLLRRCDIKDHDRIYHHDSDWHRSVRPGSVIGPELMQFLGGLYVENPKVFDDCNRRGSIQGYMCLLHDLSEWFDVGAQKRTEKGQV